ncbi:MAG: proline--tRNA ligase [Clostridiales bacterium]|nr:proline--tRNA ligase [Clostridiales bacterium]
MKFTQMLTKRFKDTPADCQIASHIFMIRGGYMKNVGNGIYSLFPITKRITSKIEAIMREEMNRIDGQEVLFPVAMPANIWKESGRFDAIGSELVRFKDRGGNDMVLGMTHEEAAVQMARETADSYTQFPFMIYQIQTKFRDEPRARGGLIRVREFTMKDAYSFHTSKEDLEQYYWKCHKAYERIFARCGVPEVISVKSDSGMMGGKVAHEFMLCTPLGEDSLVVCSDCDFRANMETAECVYDTADGSAEELDKVLTPEMKTIEDVCAFLGKAKSDSIKAVAYRLETDDSLCIVFIRGDIEVNETKLRNYLKSEVYPAEELEKEGVVAGFIGPKGLPEKVKTVYDVSLKTRASYVCGANEENYHFKGFNISRDLGEVQFVDVGKALEGGICPVCGKKTLKLTRGIEVGNIFQLGDRYTASMGMKYLDRDGSLKTPIMGCYGIGVGRLAASICEARHDDYGPIWPISIAPWQVQICALRSDDEQVKAYADKLYDELQDAGIEVLYDDRQVSAGFMFSDADLTGIPVRIVVSPKGLKAGTVEVSKRDKSYMEKLAPETVKQSVVEMVKAMLAELNNI